MIGKGYNQNKIKNSIIPNNIKNYIGYVKNKKLFEGPRIRIKEEYINDKKAFILKKTYDIKEAIDLEKIEIYKEKLDTNSTYIVIEKKQHNNNKLNEYDDIVYCGKYIEAIKKNGDYLIKFENKLYNQNELNLLYKLIIDISKKYAITNNNWKSENLEKKIMNGNHNFLFKKLNLHNIPKKLFINFDTLYKSFNGDNSNNNKHQKIENYLDNYTILNTNEDNINIIEFNINIISSKITLTKKIILTKKININNLKKSNEYFYFANIKYNFSIRELFNKFIYLGNFIKKEGDFLFFENIIINPKSEKLKNFDLYCKKKKLSK